jgi:hypothetical protein
MRSRLAGAMGLSMALAAGEGCALVWSYGSFHDQPGTGGSHGGGDAGEQGTGGGKKADNEACTQGIECASGNCVPQADAASICCASACGTCATCGVEGSRCEAVPTGMPGPGCTGSMVCDGLGHCVVPSGGACPVDGGACLSGTCVGSICCATACTTCQTCAADGSTCVDLPASTADPGCPAGTVCNGAGTCVAPGQGG